MHPEQPSAETAGQGADDACWFASAPQEPWRVLRGDATAPPARRALADPAAHRELPSIAHDHLGTPLHEVTFVVFDLETTGGSPEDAGITEVGAVKVRGGERLGELATLVHPGGPIPAHISVLTGITDAMVAAAPGMGAVLPSFLEFARGHVLVAHNAPFDLGFLGAACAHQGYGWPGFTVVDTAGLARRVLARDEVSDRKLVTLARLFRAVDEPCHRALADARATVAVLHGLLERLGGHGTGTLGELASTSEVPPRAGVPPAT